MNYLLILGSFGFPALGVKGAAIATLISRTLECGAMLAFTYLRKTPAAASFREMFDIKRTFLKKFFRTTLPVIINEGVWSLGITTYSAVYARISTESIAAFNIARTIESLAFVFFMGIGTACAIMVGNKIGAGEEQTAFQYGKRSLVIGIVIAVFLGLTLAAASGGIVSLYNISEASQGFAQRILLIAGLSLWIRASNMIIYIGMLRSGGDTRYAFFTELFTMWAIGMPLALLGSFVFHLPVYWVYLLVLSDEVIKALIGLRRVFSKRWINNLVHGISSPVQAETLVVE
jgi:putative MATE family efflux protein